MHDDRVIIAVDVGGTHTRAVVLQSLRQVSAVVVLKTMPSGATSICETISDLCRELIGKNEHVEGIAVAMACVVRPESGIVETSRKFSIQQPTDLGEMLQSALKLPTIVRTEISMAALGETTAAVPSSSRNLVVLTVGTGVGAGVVLGGVLYRGLRGCAGEVGHIPVVQSSEARLCVCGRRGCIESYAASRSITRAVAAGPWERPEEAVKAALEGDREALKAVGATSKYIALAASICANAFDPEVIMLRGGFVRGIWPLVSDSIQEHFSEYSLSPNIPLLLSRFGEDGVFRGLAIEWATGAHEFPRT
jgi:glucokinase